jgi:hypothetical protein
VFARQSLDDDAAADAAGADEDDGQRKLRGWHASLEKMSWSGCRAVAS